MPSAFSVGLTGGVGSGKSTIAAMLAVCGAGVVDADALAHRLTEAGGEAIEPLRALFGDASIGADGSLDRTRMRTRIFSDPAARMQLESLLHPMIRTAMQERAGALIAGGSAYVVFVIPLLVEAGNRRSNVDRVLVIDCSEATQMSRVRARAGIDEEMARKIIGVQATRPQRLAAADDVLLNEAPIDDIEPRVARLHRAYLRAAATQRARKTL